MVAEGIGGIWEQELSNARDYRLVRGLHVNVAGGADSERVGLEIHPAILASIWLYMDLRTVRPRKVVMGSALAVCCRTVIKKRICT